MHKGHIMPERGSDLHERGVTHTGDPARSSHIADEMLVAVYQPVMLSDSFTLRIRCSDSPLLWLVIFAH